MKPKPKKATTRRAKKTKARNLPSLSREEIERLKAGWPKSHAQLEAERLIKDPEAERRRIISPFERVHPKIRALAKQDVRIERIPMPDFLDNPLADSLVDYIKVPGRRGRFAKKETAQLARQVRELVAQGMSQHRIARHLGMKYHDLRSLIQRIKART